MQDHDDSMTQRRILEMIAEDLPLTEILGAIARACEVQEPALLLMICLVAPDRLHLRPAVAPSLPPSYLSSITNLPIGMESGAFGAAAHLKQMFITADLTADPPWSLPFRVAALEHGLRAAVARPLLGPQGDLVGVLGGFYREPRGPTAAEMEVIAAKAHLAAIAMVRRRQEDEVRLLREAVSHFHDKEQSFQSQKMEAVGRLAGGIAHDLNNMLTVIRGIGEIVLSELAEGDPLRADMAEITSAAERATALTRQLLAFSRKQVLNPQVLSLNSFMVEMDKRIRRVIGEDVDLSTNLAPDLAMVKADPGQMEQVFMNLVVNARDAMPDGGKLTLETANVELDESYAKQHIDTPPGRYVMLAVSDTGHGMDRSVRERIFDPFFTTKEKGKGTGLGLSTVYGIVKQSGGHISVYSEVGQGTSFKVYLPVTNEKPSTASTQRMAGISLKGHETVLLVEDEAQVRRVTRECLTRSGYVVLEAAGGDEAIAIVDQHPGPIHLLVTDVVMPRMNGQQIAARLTASRPEMRVLFMSGYTENSLGHRDLLAEGTAFIEKPFSLDALARKVRGLLDGDPK